MKIADGKIILHRFEPPLEEVRFLKREKRFLAHVEFEDGRREIAHCANTGSMMGCLLENQPALISRSDNPKRKLKYTLECLKVGDTWIEVNTHRTNKIFRSIVEQKVIDDFRNFKTIKGEVSIFDSRFDFLVEMKNGDRKFVEVKQVTLVNDGIAAFPDAVTTRGQKHLRDLMKVVESGMEAYMVYIAKRDDCDKFRSASEIDPEYSLLLKEAAKIGVKIIPISCVVDKNGIYFKNFIEAI
jgi:sugar fermentation stimulation protein A